MRSDFVVYFKSNITNFVKFRHDEIPCYYLKHLSFFVFILSVSFNKLSKAAQISKGDSFNGITSATQHSIFFLITNTFGIQVFQVNENKVFQLDYIVLCIYFTIHKKLSTMIYARILVFTWQKKFFGFMEWVWFTCDTTSVHDGFLVCLLYRSPHIWLFVLK